MVAPHDLTFAQALGVEPLGADCFEGVYAERAQSARVFGGNVLGKTVMAASATFETPKVLHSLHGYFFRPATPGVDRSSRSIGFVTAAALRIVRCAFPSEELKRPASSSRLRPPRKAVSTNRRCPRPVIRMQWWPRSGCIPSSSSNSDLPHPTLMGFTRGLVVPCFDVHRTSETIRSSRLRRVPTSRITRAPQYGPGDSVYDELSGDASLDHALDVHRIPDLTKWHLSDLRCISISSNRSAIQGRIFAETGELIATMSQERLVRPLSGPLPERSEVGLWRPAP